jgi:hypothetical protein
MSSRSRPLPNIPVKHTAVRKVINFTPPVEAKLRAYIAYYTQLQGFDPKQAPGESDTIVAILENFLDNDRGFNRHLRDETQRSLGNAAAKAPRSMANTT